MIKHLTAVLALTLIFTGIASAEEKQAPLKGNVRTKIVHSSECTYYKRPNCKAEFKDRKAAAAAGYKECRICFKKKITEKKTDKE